jgi:hypothetical protein
MEIKPFIAKKPPEYPTEYLFINNPELFRRYIPLRWYKNQLVCTALSVFIVAGATSCDSLATKPNTEITDPNGKDKPSKDNNDSIKVAPIFVHGDGSGAVGCMVISPPVFITESEAIQIIMEELGKENIKLDTNSRPNFHFESNAIANDSYIDDKVRIASIDMKIDGMDIEHKFMIEFVSTDDYSLFKTKPMPSDTFLRNSSVHGFDTKQAAEIVRDQLIKKSISNAVVFYDPIASVEEEDDPGDIKAKAEAKKLLVAQVQDFINWLKTEEIIK